MRFELRRRVEAEFVQIDNPKLATEFVVDLLFAHDRRPRIMRLFGIAGQY